MFYILQSWNIFLLGCAKLEPVNIYDSIEYNLNFSNIKNSVLIVEMILTGKFSNESFLNLSYGKFNSTACMDQIKNIKTYSNSLTKLKQEKKSIKITYEIHQKKGNSSNVHDAIVRNDLFHAPGYRIFAVPLMLIRLIKKI